MTGDTVADGLSPTTATKISPDAMQMDANARAATHHVSSRTRLTNQSGGDICIMRRAVSFRISTPKHHLPSANGSGVSTVVTGYLRGRDSALRTCTCQKLATPDPPATNFGSATIRDHNEAVTDAKTRHCCGCSLYPFLRDPHGS
jgi:hypothetical protein